MEPSFTKGRKFRVILIHCLINISDILVFPAVNRVYFCVQRYQRWVWLFDFYSLVEKGVVLERKPTMKERNGIDKKNLLMFRLVFQLFQQILNERTIFNIE